MPLTDVKHLAATLAKLIEMERDPVEFWRNSCLRYWRLYLRNQAAIAVLKRQNRTLRRFLADILPADWNGPASRPGVNSQN